MSGELNGGNAPYLRRIQRRDLLRQKNIKIRWTSSGIRSFRVTRRRHSLESTQRSRRYGKPEQKGYITRIMSKLDIKGRLDRCFRA
jgi:hypothetical protein